MQVASPLLTVNQYGQGRAIYIAVPLERAIAQGDQWATPVPARAMLREVYGAVAQGGRVRGRRCRARRLTSR